MIDSFNRTDAQVLDAVYGILAEGGFVGVRHIARRSGVSRATIQSRMKKYVKDISL